VIVCERVPSVKTPEPPGKSLTTIPFPVNFTVHCGYHAIKNIVSIIRSIGICIRRIAVLSSLRRRNLLYRMRRVRSRWFCYPKRMVRFGLPDGIESSKKSKRLAPTSVAPSMSHTGPNLLGGEVWDMVVNSKGRSEPTSSVIRSSPVSHDLKEVRCS